MDCDDEYESSQGLYNTNLFAYKAIIYIFTNSVSGPFLECLINIKMIMIMIGGAGAGATWVDLVLSASPLSLTYGTRYPPWVVLSIWTLLTWSTRELEALASKVQAPGVSPLILGSSGIPSRYLSSFILNSSTLHFVVFHTLLGRVLNCFHFFFFF